MAVSGILDCVNDIHHLLVSKQLPAASTMPVCHKFVMIPFCGIGNNNVSSQTVTRKETDNYTLHFLHDNYYTSIVILVLSV